MRNGINRGLQWIKKVLEITEVATVPTQVLPEVRPGVDVFGWERLPEVQASTASAAATTIVQSAVTPADTLRLVLSAAVKHTDVGVPHDLWITKAIQNTIRVGLPTDRGALIEPNVFASLIGGTYLVQGDFLFGETDVATAGGTDLILTMMFVDLPIGEYIPSF